MINVGTINDAVAEATAKCNSALSLVAEANALVSGNATGSGVVFNQHHCDLLIERAFMCLFETLESYMECVFICYMLGEVGSNGNAVVRYVNPINSEHAEKILRGKEQYIDFTSRQVIIAYAEGFFQNGGPFPYLNSVSQDFEDMKKIRNKLSHVSIKSQRDFEGLVRSRVSFLPSGVSVASFLMTSVPRQTESFFVHYLNTTTGIITALANPAAVTP